MTPTPPTSENLRLMLEPLDLGSDVRALSLELVEPADPTSAIPEDSPALGPEVAAIWAAALPAIAADIPWALDFFSHLDRVREFCRAHAIDFREAAARCVVIPQIDLEPLSLLLARFQTETFGFRAGALLEFGDAPLENEISHRGIDAYHQSYRNYFTCAVCDFENGALTLLTEKLSSSELLRRLKPALAGHAVTIVRPE
jgi:hypothetical protein